MDFQGSKGRPRGAPESLEQWESGPRVPSSPSPTRQGQITDAAEADAIYTDGTILTMSDAQPTAVAVAVKDGKILAVGSKEMAIRQVWCGGCDR